MDLREQACWFLLVFESKLSIRQVNDILVLWCKQSGRSLQEFFAADPHVWRTTCRLSDELIQKLVLAKEKQVAQAFLVEQLQHEQIKMMTVLDAEYPKLIKSVLTRSQIPSLLFSMGDLEILHRKTIAVIGSRQASTASLAFTQATSEYLGEQGANIISGNARGVDRAAFDGAMQTEQGHTTMVLPHGIRKLSKVQMQDLLPSIQAGKVLLLSQFHPDAPWLVSRAMERNALVTSLAQIVVVAESDSKGGTWEGANGALKQRRRLYVRHTENETGLVGNALLLERGGLPLLWPTENLPQLLSPLLEESQAIKERQEQMPAPPEQLSLLGSTQGDELHR